MERAVAQEGLSGSVGGSEGNFQLKIISKMEDLQVKSAEESVFSNVKKGVSRRNWVRSKIKHIELSE
jgi:hypothetical protein